MRKTVKIVNVIVLFVFCFINTEYIKAEEKVDQFQTYSNKISNYYGNGYEDYNTEVTKEMYSGYVRNGNFKFFDASEGKAYNATEINIKWENGTVQYFKVGNIYKKKESNDASREITKYRKQKVVLITNTSMYKEPFLEMSDGDKKVDAGIYISEYASGDFIQIILNDGSTTWINPQYEPEFVATNRAYYMDVSPSLSVDSIGGIPIKQKFMPIREDKRTGITMKPQYVTIHNTANSSVGANALAHANAQINDNREWVSWHYTVDNTEIYQSMPINEMAYHAGDGLSSGNASSVAIEICENSDGDYQKSEKNAGMLAARILFENGLTPNDLRMHKDWSGKACAHNIINRTKGSMGWDNFKQYVNEEYNKLSISKNKKINVFSFINEGEAIKGQFLLKNNLGLESNYYKTGNSAIGYKIVSGGFEGENEAKKAEKVLENLSNLEVEIKMVGTVDGEKEPVYHIKSGGFVGLDAVRQAVDYVRKEFGWYVYYTEDINENGLYNLITGGFIGNDVEIARSELYNKTNWYLGVYNSNYLDSKQTEIYKVSSKEYMDLNIAIAKKEKVVSETGWWMNFETRECDLYGLSINDSFTVKESIYWSDRIKNELNLWNQIY